MTRTVCIENHTSEVYKIQLTSIQCLQLLPGVNINVPLTVYNHLKNYYPHYKALFDKGLLEVRETNTKKVYEDTDTGVTYIDDGGEKVPIVQAKSNGQNVPLVTGAKYTVQDLRAKGFSPSLSKKIIENTPNAGWRNKEQIINFLSLSGKNLEKVQQNLDLPEK